MEGTMGDEQEAPRRTWARPKPRRLAFAGLAVLLLAASACGDDDDDSGSSSSEEGASQENAAELLGPEDPASGEPVRIGFVSDGQTPNFDNRDEIRSAEAAAEWWNEHHGGIGGRPIEVVSCETVSDPATATDCGNQMVEQDVVAVTLSQSAVAEAVWEPIHEAGIPFLLFQASGDNLTSDDQSTFIMTNPQATLFGLPIAAAEAEDTDTIAFVNIDVPVALSSFESGAADRILGNADLDYELIRIPPGTADMTSQMGQVVDSGAGVVQVVGNDAFCIAAYQGLTAVGYEGAITSVSQCITDATREALPDQLEGISIIATQALGDEDNTAYQRYQAVMEAYGDEVEDVPNALAMGGYTTMTSLATALQGIEGDVTPETAIQALKSMPEADFPGADGLTFQCGGSAFPSEPAVCTNQSLRAVLDAEGNPASYEPVDSTEILEGL
jgi:branched-chain amino acid transport system substrate-binding protein